MIYLQLFVAYLQVGLFSIGGGHASIPVAQSVVVDGYGWLNLQEFTAMITLSEMTPGPFSINSATYVGTKMGGILGGVVTTLGFLLPSVVICSLLYFVVKRYRKVRAVDGFMQGIRPAVSGLISSAGFSLIVLAILGLSDLSAAKNGVRFNPVALAIFTLAFIIIRKTKINPVLIIILSGVIGAGLYLIFPQFV